MGSNLGLPASQQQLLRRRPQRERARCGRHKAQCPLHEVLPLQRLVGVIKLNVLSTKCCRCPRKDAEERPAAATSVTTHFQAKSIKCASGDLCQLPGKFFVWTAQAQEFSAANYGPDTAPVRCPDCRKNRTRSCMLARRGPHQGAGGSGGGRG